MSSVALNSGIFKRASAITHDFLGAQLKIWSPVRMYLDFASNKFIFFNFFEIFQCLLDSQLSNSIDLKSHIFVIFCYREQQNLSVRCRAKSNTDRSCSLLCIKNCLCQPTQNYRNQILVSQPCSFPRARRLN